MKKQFLIPLSDFIRVNSRVFVAKRFWFSPCLRITNRKFLRFFCKFYCFDPPLRLLRQAFGFQFSSVPLCVLCGENCFDLLRVSVPPWWVLILVLVLVLVLILILVLGLVLVLVCALTMPKTLYPFSPTSKRAEC